MRLGLVLAAVGILTLLPKTELYLSRVQEPQTAQELAMSVDHSAVNLSARSLASSGADDAKSIMLAATKGEHHRVSDVTTSRDAMISPM